MKKQIIFSLLMALMFLAGTAFAGNGMMNGSSSPMQRNSNMKPQYMSPQQQKNGGMMMNHQGCDSTQQMSVMIKMMTNPSMIKLMAQMKGLSKTERSQMLNRHMKMVQKLIDANKKINCSKRQQAGMMSMVTNPMMIKWMGQMEGMNTGDRMMRMRNNASMMMRMMRMGMMSGNGMMMNGKNGR